jgi:hypothetical protein
MIYFIIIRLKQRRRIKDTLNTCLGQGTGRICTLHERLLNGTFLNILKGQAMVCLIVEQILKVHAMVVTIIIIKFSPQ